MSLDADWVAAIATFAAVIVAVFNDWIRALVWRPVLEASIRTHPPDCLAVPVSDDEGRFVASAVFLRLLIKNTGNATAQQVEVYAAGLQLRGADGVWKDVPRFPPTNLVWANLGGITALSQLTPNTGRYCDLGHIIDPNRRALLAAWQPDPPLLENQTCFEFALSAKPNHKGHIVAFGHYRLRIVLSAENARAVTRIVALHFDGQWDPVEATMLNTHVDVSVEKH